MSGQQQPAPPDESLMIDELTAEVSNGAGCAWLDDVRDTREAAYSDR